MRARRRPAEPALARGAGQVQDDDHPHGLRGEDEQDVDGVCGEEAVGLGAASELLREQRARTRGCEREHDLRERRERAASEGAAAVRKCSETVWHARPTLL